MAIGDFNFTPTDGWNNATEFPDYPARDQVRPLMQKLFDQIKTWLNSTVKTEVNTHLAETMSKVVLVTEPYNQTTTTTVNLGFRPKHVQIIADIEATKYESVGSTDGTSSYCRFKQVSDDTYSIIINPIYLRYNITNYVTGTVAFTDTGLTITWSATGTLTGASGNRRLIVSAITH